MKLHPTWGLLACLMIPAVARANDASVGLIYKGVYYTQASTAAPVLGVNPYVGNAQVVESGAGTILPSPAITPSIVAGGATALSFFDGASYSMGNDSDPNSVVRYAALADLNAAFPTGYHTLSYTGLTQSSSWTMNVPATTSLSSFPVAPHVSNFAAISSFPAANGLTINWDPLGGSSISSLVVVVVVDQVTGQAFTSPLSITTGLTGASTSYSFPAADFTPLHTYAGAITYAKVPTTLGIFPITYTDGFSNTGAYVTTSITAFTLNATPAPGDANGDGQVNVDDYLAIDHGYLNHLTGWTHGDFNGDGIVNDQDYAIIDSAYRNLSGALAEGDIALHTAEFGQPYVEALVSVGASAIPEPASLVMLALGSSLLLHRRRRSSR